MTPELATLALLAPALLAAAALSATLGPGLRPRRSLGLGEAAAGAALVIGVAAAAGVALSGARTSLRLELAGVALALRLDALSVTILLLVAFIGLVVLRYSRNYLDGNPRQGAFVGGLCLTLAAVMLLVLSGTLWTLVAAWVATSLALHRLLVFYPERPAAAVAARKKFVTARLGDLCLLGAAVLLYGAFGTADIATLLESARALAPETAPAGVPAAALLIAVAALLKSAQFPTHGWLTEVMETPTPVSALLHAGIINAGGFLAIRFADLLLLAPASMHLLAIVGGFTALFAGLVMLTQPSVKVSLAWSTAAQMGFMMLQCGLGAFALAVLHIVAHALYKAHAFLRAAEAGQTVRDARRLGPVAVPGPRTVAQAMGIAVALYVLVGLPLGLVEKSPQAVALGAILVLGVGYLVAQGLADAAPRALGIATAKASAFFTAGYFAFQWIAQALTSGTLPPTPTAGPLEWALIALTLGSFATVAVLQALLPVWSHHPAAQGLRVHAANGFYLNALTDRLVGAWSVPHRSTEV